jgi:hypothetical protein
LGAGAVLVTNDEGNVYLRFFDRIGKGSIAFDAEFHLHAGVKRCKVRESGRENRGEVLRAANANVACDSRALHGIQQLVIQRKNTAGVSENYFSGFCQDQAPPTFAKESCAQIIPQALHLQADGGRCAAKALRRLRQTAKIVGNGKRSQSIKVEIGARRHGAVRSLAADRVPRPEKEKPAPAMICRHWLKPGASPGKNSG